MQQSGERSSWGLVLLMVGLMLGSILIQGAGQSVPADEVNFTEAREDLPPDWHFSTDSPMNDVAISADGEYIVAGSNTRNVYLFAKNSETPLWSYQTPTGINEVAISADGGWLVAGGHGAAGAYLFEKDSNQPVWNFQPGDDIRDVAISADGEYIVIARSSGHVHLFSQENNVPLWTFSDWNEEARTVDISSNGEYIAAGGYSDHIALFHKDSSTPQWTHDTNGDVDRVVISEDGQYVAAIVSPHNILYLLNKDGGGDDDWTLNLDEGTSSFTSVAISGDGEYIVAGTAHGKVRLYNKESNELLWEHDTTAQVKDVAISADGNHIIAGSETEYVYLYHRSTSTPVSSYYTGGDFTSHVDAVSISANGADFVAGTTLNTILKFTNNNITENTAIEDTEKDAWLHLELLSWEANASDEWDTDGTDIDVQFQVCIDVDGESDGISPYCSWTQIWDDSLTLGSVWDTTFDLPENSTTLSISIECWDNDEAADEWGNGPDACDMSPSNDEWRLHFEANWSNITTTTFSGNGDLDNDTEWNNAESNWRVSINYYGDEDSDGVSDYVDQCFETLSDVEIDQSGCSWQQYDWDGDGLVNAEDPCPKIGDDYCGVEGDYLFSKRIGTSGVYAAQSGPATIVHYSYMISPNGEYLAYHYYNTHGNTGDVFGGYDGATIVNLGISEMYLNFQNTRGILGFAMEIDEVGSMEFSRDSEIFFTTNFGGISGYDPDGNDSWDHYPNGARVPRMQDDPSNSTQQHSELQDSDGDGTGDSGCSDHWRRISVSQNGQFVYGWYCSGGLIWDRFSGSEIAYLDGSDYSPFYQYLPNGNHHDFASVMELWLRPDGLAIIGRSSGTADLMYAHSPPEQQPLQTIQLPFDVVNLDAPDDGNSVVILSSSETESSIQIFDLLTGVSRTINDDDDRIAKSVSISDNGLRIVVVYEDEIEILERDRDSDGFVDSQDLCPLISGDISGCIEEFFDTDGDGINDGDDQCPSTAEGTSVDSVGCAMNQLDSDADGISDATDQCPNTPNGDTVGLTGCSSVQIDSDGDGVYDSSDDCPNTTSGASVDANGCNTSGGDVVDPDSDNDGVRDSVDQCANSAAGIVVNAEGCESEGDVQSTQSGETSSPDPIIYAAIAMVVLVIIGAISILSRGSEIDGGWGADEEAIIPRQQTNPRKKEIRKFKKEFEAKRDTEVKKYVKLGLDEIFATAIVMGANEERLMKLWEVEWRKQYHSDDPLIKAIIDDKISLEDGKWLNKIRSDSEELCMACVEGKVSIEWARTVIECGFGKYPECVELLLEGMSPIVVAKTKSLDINEKAMPLSLSEFGEMSGSEQKSIRKADTEICPVCDSDVASRASMCPICKFPL